MLDVSVIGLGNAGSQVAALAAEKLNIPVYTINSSEKDLQTIPESIPRLLIGDQKGAGKERAAAKKFLRDAVVGLIQNEEAKKVFDTNVLFIVSSTGGGTGSGTALIMANIMEEVYPNTKIIVVGILPTLKEALSTQVNSIGYLEELYKTLDGATYMLYDNDKLSKLPSTVMMQKINEAIVNDIDVLRGTYQYPTRYSSIDEKDATNILDTSGRIVVASITDLKEKDIDETTVEELLIQQFKTNAHAEIQRDKTVIRTGVITNLESRINERFDTHIPMIQEFLGTPVEEFEHIVVNEDRHIPNNVFLIAAGLTQVNDRIRRINERIEEINERQKQLESESELGAIDMDGARSKITHKAGSGLAKGENIDLQGIFSKFNVD